MPPWCAFDFSRRAAITAVIPELLKTVDIPPGIE